MMGNSGKSNEEIAKAGGKSPDRPSAPKMSSPAGKPAQQ